MKSTKYMSKHSDFEGCTSDHTDDHWNLRQNGRTLTPNLGGAAWPVFSVREGSLSDAAGKGAPRWPACPRANE
jgi:hypothetical protein